MRTVEEKDIVAAKLQLMQLAQMLVFNGMVSTNIYATFDALCAKVFGEQQ